VYAYLPSYLMDTKLIKNYQNPSLSVSIAEASEIIETLKSTVQSKKEYDGFCFNLQKYMDEIHYYERAILCTEERQWDASKEEIRLLKQHVSKLEGTIEMLLQLLAKKT
jgi:hypothetical protein